MSARDRSILLIASWPPARQSDLFPELEDQRDRSQAYSCVLKTIEVDLPNEAAFLRRYDEFRSKVEALVDMPGKTIDLLFRMLRQNKGRLSKRGREREFAQLTAQEVHQVEEAYAGIIEISGFGS